VTLSIAIRRARVLSAALALLAGTGCDFGERCTVESRTLEYEAGRGYLELVETRGAENATFILWHVRVDASVGTATRAVLREGTPDAPGRVLYDFPLVNPVPASGVVTQVFVRTAYAGEIPFAELWELLGRQPVSFEVGFDGDVPPVRDGPLERSGFSDWQETCS
jgi:hypothetical protein